MTPGCRRIGYVPAFRSSTLADIMCRAVDLLFFFSFSMSSAGCSLIDRLVSVENMAKNGQAFKGSLRQQTLIWDPHKGPMIAHVASSGFPL